MREIDRFCSLFEQEVLHTFDYLGDLPIDEWNGIPVDSDTLYLGTRIQKITISSLARHLMHTEQFWIGIISSLPPDAVVPLPGKPTGTEKISDGKELLDIYRESLADNLLRLKKLSPETLGAEIMFVDRRYTVMGFLWSILGHHGYHLGQIDLLMRQQGTEAPEYMEWPEKGKVLG